MLTHYMVEHSHSRYIAVINGYLAYGAAIVHIAVIVKYCFLHVVQYGVSYDLFVLIS